MYNPAAFASPTLSLAAAFSAPVSVVAEPRAPNLTLLEEYQSLENPRCRGVENFSRMHLWPMANCPKHFESDENNMLAGLTLLHEMLDGRNTIEQLPYLRLRYLKSDGYALPLKKNRFRVWVEILFFNAVAEIQMKGRLKEGTVQVAPLTWRTFVYVKNPTDFKVCLDKRTRMADRAWAGRHPHNQASLM
jgi:hypothetical protein